MTATVTVIGVNGHNLPPGAESAISAARLVVGDHSALQRWAAAALAAGGGSSAVQDDGPRMIELAVPDEVPDTALADLAAAVEADEPAVVLVTGDPGYFGVLRALRGYRLPTVCWPSPSYLQRIAAMIQRPWDDVTVVHTQDGAFGKAVNVCRARPAVCVLTGPGAGPAELGAELVGWRRTLVVVEDPSGPAEQLSIVDPVEAAGRTWREPVAVLCLADLDHEGTRGWLGGGEPVPPVDGWALPADEFTFRDGFGSQPEMRALALARLAPRPGTLVWEVAAGCGALGVEAARMGAAVIAVENDPGLCVRIVANAKRHGVDVRMVDGQLPASLVGLPRPDAVFLATARPDVLRACATVGADRIVVEVREFGSIGPARDVLTDAGYAVDGRLLFAAPIEGLSRGTAAVDQASSTLLLWATRR
ncbi:bifunctional cobalt-precorrin-7 (C(5))-methyltransferase/cobalt-precorrin-6B (C(15))-methyltransferase [Actinophytocola sediminis]